MMNEENRKPNDDLRLSESEWKSKRQDELRNQEFDKLILKVIDLESDNRKLREKVAPEGSATLSKAESERWARYQSFGKPEELEQMIADAQGAREELKGYKRQSQIREVSDLMGYKPAVLQRLGSGLEFDIQEVENEGQKSKVAFVKNGESSIPVSEYASKEWADFMPALSAQAQEVKPEMPMAAPKMTFPTQKSVGEAPKIDIEYIKQRKLESGKYSP